MPTGSRGNFLEAFRLSADRAVDSEDHQTVLGERFPQTLIAARTGAEWAWESIYRDLAPPLLGYLGVRGAVDPEDVLGEVFLQVVRDLRSFKGGEREFRAWVFVIAHHRMLDEARRRSRKPVELRAELPLDHSSSPDAEDEMLRGMAADGVRQVLNGLSPDQRNVLLLRVLGDLTVDEVAKALGKSSGAVKALQRRGLEALEQTLSRDGVTPGPVPTLTRVTWDVSRD